MPSGKCNKNNYHMPWPVLLSGESVLRAHAPEGLQAQTLALVGEHVEGNQSDVSLSY